MRVGLISINMYSKGLNFACPLHNWAFQEFLRKNGIESTIIDYLPNYYDNFDSRNPGDYYEKKVNTWTDKYNAAVKSGNQENILLAEAKIKEHSQLRDSYKQMARKREIRYDKFQNFINDRYIKTARQYDSALLEVKDPGFDCYICVTDAIWKKEPHWGYEPGFFLASSCMENKWKISYAASTYFTQNDDDKALTERWIRDIDYVSVREDFLRDKIAKTIRPDVTHVIDPVLLHDASVYESFLVKPKEKKYLLLYYVMNENPEIITHAINYAKANNLSIVELSDQAIESNLIKESGVKVVSRYDIGIEEWLGYIHEAECVFTNSFHVCCFSILFKKIVFAERRKYDKVGALLDMVGLSNLIINGQDFTQKITPNVNWNTVHQKLAIKRAQSEVFILGAITAAEHKTHPVKDYLPEKMRQKFPIFYNIGRKAQSVADHMSDDFSDSMGKTFVRPRSIEFQPVQSQVTNNGTFTFHQNVFKFEGLRFVGWRLRVGLMNRAFLMLADGSFIDRLEYKGDLHGPCKIFKAGDKIPVLPLNGIRSCVVEAVWAPVAE